MYNRPYYNPAPCGPPDDMPSFVRGTTPEFEYALTDKDGEAYDIEDVEELRFTLSQEQASYGTSKKVKITKTREDIAVNGNVLSFYLTHDESLTFQEGLLKVQAWASQDGSEWATVCPGTTVKVLELLEAEQ